jgi:hypothetical protein
MRMLDHQCTFQQNLVDIYVASIHHLAPLNNWSIRHDIECLLLEFPSASSNPLLIHEIAILVFLKTDF